MHNSLREVIEKLIAQAIETQYPKVVLEHAHLLSGKKTWLYFDRGLDANAKYIEMHVPEVIAGGMSILDVGPGPGHFLLLCRELGNEVAGSDRAISLFGESQPNAYQALTDHFNLGVVYHGFERYLKEAPPWPDGSFDLINFRGSIDGVLAVLGGEHQHVRDLLGLLHRMLKPGGNLMVSHNSGPMCDSFRNTIGKGVTGWEVAVNEPTITRMRKVDVATLPVPMLESMASGSHVDATT